jgi:hypothetical protein
MSRLSSPTRQHIVEDPMTLLLSMLSQLKLNEAVAPRSALCLHDREAAAGLKPALLDLQRRVRLGRPMVEGKPVEKAGGWTTPDGQHLAQVVLSQPESEVRDGVTVSALVNLKKNEFYFHSVGGIAGQNDFHGPLALPQSVHFVGRSFGPAAVKEVEQRANAAEQRIKLKDIPQGITGPNAGASLEGAVVLNPAAKKARVSLKVSGTGFDDTPPKYKVTRLQVFAVGKAEPVLTVDKPHVFKKSSARGLTSHEFQLDLPLAKVDRTKKYIVVASVGINGAPTQLVRTSALAVTRAN